MKIEVYIPDSIALPLADYEKFAQFLQRMANRCAAGYTRYGRADQAKRYMSRMLTETQAYKRHGNMEQLYNIAVYAYLESMAPEHPAMHFDPAVDSVTRKRFK